LFRQTCAALRSSFELVDRFEGIAARPIFSYADIIGTLIKRNWWIPPCQFRDIARGGRAPVRDRKAVDF
jgi:hypothetical protein